MNTHHVKSWPEFFKATASGLKTFDIRKDDREPRYQPGDTITFEEFKPGTGTYTGLTTTRTISYILRDFDGLQEGYCILGLES